MGDTTRSALSGDQVRDALVDYLVNTLCALDSELYFFLPKIPVIPDWAGWDEEMKANTVSDGSKFCFLYQAFLPDMHDSDWLCESLTKIWQNWGWECRSTQFGTHYDLTCTSPDSFEFAVEGVSSQRHLVLSISSPTFDAPADDDTVAMPFAVTLAGPRSLSEIQQLHPELFN